MNIIKPVDRALIHEELIKDKFIRTTNNGNNEIYVIDYRNAPNTIREIGRLREISFRDAGGGTGKELDLDKFDTGNYPYQQLIVWNPEDNEIVGGYRYIHCKDAGFNEEGKPDLATTELFNFSETFIKDYLPYTIELGRSFVQPAYQPTVDIRKGMYSLDNLWDGLGALFVDNPYSKYYFGKITMYPRFNIVARDLILYFLRKYFIDKDELVTPKIAVELKTDMIKLKNTLYGKNYNDDYKILVQEVRRHNENLPPLVNAYMNLSSTMKYFGTAINHGFGAVEESAIIIALEDIYDIKKARHLSTYIKGV